MNVNYKYLFKNLLFNTNEIIKEFYTDFRKDQNSKNIKKKPYRIWIFGLPKSGTTLVEQIMDQLPYIRVDRSVLRKFSNKDLLDTKNYKKYLNFFPENKFSYLKTHLEFDISMVSHLKSQNYKIIVTLRDIRDAMISRYFHIKNDKNHWQHEVVKNENFEKGFLDSLVKKTEKFPKNVNFVEPLKYYYDWILNWKNIEDKKIIKLWFESYNSSPLQYIKNILTLTKFNNYDEKQIFELIKIKNSKDKNKTFAQRIKSKNRNLSTFRSGKSGEWKELFTRNIEKEFLIKLPNDLNKVINNQ